MESSIPNDSSNSEVATLSAADQKVLGDLNILTEKMDQCHTQLNERKGTSDTISKTSELYEIVGFLEACAPRMVELVEACAQGNGGLSDVVLMKALDVNDRLIKSLSELDNITFVDRNDEPDISLSSGQQQQQQNTKQSTEEDEFDAFLLNERTNDNTATSNLDDLLS